MKDSIITFFLTLIALLITDILAPLVEFAESYFIGLILSMLIGDALTKSINLLLGTDRFTADNLPIICAALGFVGGYFKSNINTNNF